MLRLEGDYLTTREAAELAGRTVAWVCLECRAGRIPGAVRVGGSLWLVPRSGLEWRIGMFSDKMSDSPRL